MGKISSRGQIAIPTDIRNQLDLHDGAKVLFLTENGNLIMKKVTAESFEHITGPLKKAAKESKLKQKDIDGIIHRARKINK